MTQPVPRARAHGARLSGFVLVGLLLAACATPSVPDESRAVGETAPEAATESSGADAAAVMDPSWVYTGKWVDHEVETPAPAPLQTGGRGGRRQNFHVLLGMRFLDDNVWDPLDEQPVLGFEFDTRARNSVLGFEAGLASSYDWDRVGALDLDTWTFELYAGPRVTFGDRNATVHPYVGAGLSWFYTDLETFFPVRVRDSDNSFAAYAHTGIYFAAGGGTNVGVDVRGLFGSDLDLFGGDFDGDYLQIALLLGGGF